METELSAGGRRVRLALLAASAALIPIVCGPAAEGLVAEALPGGGATSREPFDNRDAFSHPSHGIDLEGEARFKIGNAIFRRLWVSAPSSTTASDGLGPLYNARGCQNCHLKDGRGRPPEGDETAVSMFLRLSIPPRTDEHRRLLAERHVNLIGDPVYGAQLQNVAVQGLAAEGRMTIAYDPQKVQLGDGTTVELRAPRYGIADLGYGPLSADVMLSPRVAPQMIGLGLLEAVPEADIRAGADPEDANGDGISGRTNEVWDLAAKRTALGRFGWKAGNPNIRQQSAEAAAIDIGLSNTVVPLAYGDCTPAQTACLAKPNGNTDAAGGFELPEELLDLVVFYAENLAVPVRRDLASPLVAAGQWVFTDIGCAACHRPSFKTGAVEGQPHLSGQTIWPYTDLLLHDLGPGLADGRPEGAASGSEWRTPPLWGVGLTQTVSGHTYFLHDGRARSIEEAILWHGGEGQRSRDAYARLSKADRDALVAFVNSL